VYSLGSVWALACFISSVGLFQIIFEGAVKLLQYTDPVQMLIFDLVELLFHVTGKGHIHHIREKLVEFVGDDLGDLRGVEFFVDLFDIAAVLNRRDNRRIGAGPADAFFFQRLDQRGFGITGRRFGKVLLGLDIDRRQRVPCLSAGSRGSSVGVDQTRVKPSKTSMRPVAR
jgi:hypothetical protein